jgi:hypothetical protein
MCSIKTAAPRSTSGRAADDPGRATLLDGILTVNARAVASVLSRPGLRLHRSRDGTYHALPEEILTRSRGYSRLELAEEIEVAFPNWADRALEEHPEAVLQWLDEGLRARVIRSYKLPGLVARRGRVYAE